MLLVIILIFSMFGVVIDKLDNAGKTGTGFLCFMVAIMVAQIFLDTFKVVLK